MKKILTLVLVSALGGIFTLGAYKLFLEKDDKLVVTTTEAQPTFIPTNTNNIYGALETTDFTEAAENTVHAVVHVKNTAIVSRQPTIEDLFFGRRSQQAQVGTGSGVIITPDGYIITNNHVIDGSQSLSVTLNNNKNYEAKIIGTDPKTDIALLKIEANENLPYTTFADSDQAKIGEWVLAVGNPFNLTSTVTAGIISAKSRALSGSSYQSFIQTDAAVNPGNSGGALVNISGELVGINTAITSQTGSYIGYSFAVPSNVARKVIEDIMEFGNVQNGILGISALNTNSKFAVEKGLNEIEGVYVSEIEKGSGADIAGINEGDIIKKLDQVEITKFSDLRGFLNAKRPNDVIQVTIERNGNLKTLPVKLLSKQSFNLPILGDIKNASPSELRKFKASYGVKISKLTENKEYANYWIKNGVKEGSIVTAINNIKINSIDDVENIIRDQSSSEPLRIELINSYGEKESHNFRDN